MTGTPRAAAPGRLLVAVLLGLAAAWQVPSTLTVRATDLISPLTFRGFGDAESGFRWSGAKSEIVFPDPGPGWPVRVEVDLSAWRPRGRPAPVVTVTAGGHGVTVQPPPGTETRGTATVGLRYPKGQVRFDGGFYTGLTASDERTGVKGGLTWTFESFLGE